MAAPAYRDLGFAISAVMDEADITTVALAEQLRARGWKVDQSLISKWRNGHKEPVSIRLYPDIDDACGVPRGHILRRAGYVDEVDNTVEAAIHADPGLDLNDKDMLLGMVQSLRMRYTARVAREQMEPNLDDPDEAELWGLASYSEDERRQLIQGLREIRAQRPPRRRRRRAG